MRERTRIMICFLLLMVPISCAGAEQVDSALVEIDQNLGLWMREWGIPGMAVGVVKDGRQLVCKGYGFRNVEEQQPVTPGTVFSIASISKAFTSLSAALLVDAGKLEWDEPLVALVPEFKVADSLISQEMTIRDMLCHRTGLPEHFMLYDINPSDRERLFSSLQYTRPALGFRQQYHYNNVVYAAAGYIVGRIAGNSWEEFVRAELFDPLGMNNSSFDLGIQEAAEYAYPYVQRDGSFHRVPFRATRSTNPSGGINASLDDMLKWLNLYLRRGRIGEDRFVSAENLAETYEPQIPTKFVPWSSTSPMEAYGLGWTVEVYRGSTMISHGGILSDKYASWVAWLPREKIGIVILSNADTMLPYYLSYIIAEKLTGIDIAYWNDILAKEAASRREPPADESIASSAIPRSLAGDLKGVYFHPAYGNAEVRIEDTVSTIWFSEECQLPLSYVSDSTLKAVYQKYDYPFEIRLDRDANNRVVSFTGAFCPREEVEFRRVRDMDD